MELQALLTQDQRLVILQTLSQNHNEANEQILQECLDVYGHNVSQDLVRTHLNWLAEQGLIWLNQVGALKIASLTQRGLDVAEGRAYVDGVKKPRPKW